MINLRIHRMLRSESCPRRMLSTFSSPKSSSPAVSDQKLTVPRISFQQHAVAQFASAPFNPMRNSFRLKKCWFSSSMAIDAPVIETVDVPLAQTGEGIAECEVLRWFVQEGEQVDDFQPLCEVQSDKATIEITSRYKGKVAQILYNPGDIVKVGETLLKMVVEESQVSTQTCDGLDDESIPSELQDSNSQTHIGTNRNTCGALSTPAVRNIAKQYGINISDVLGTGKDGRILKEDVLSYAYAARKEAANESSSSSSSDSYVDSFVDTRVPLRGFQRTMVKTMTMAARIPHFYYVEDINCQSLMELKASFQRENSNPQIKYTFLPLLIKSLSMAMSKFPLLNSCFNEESHEIILKGSHNIGIAMATPQGLVVPNIKKVQSMSIFEITKELSRLQQLALENKLSPEDVCGGTITLSNIGAIGGKFGSPLLNMPEVSIIALGRIQKVPQFADDGNVHPVPVMTVNIGSDHRVLDGATVARFCNEWKLYIEKPELLMLYMR